MASVKRRSIIEFEKWLQGEIAVATLEMQNMDDELALIKNKRLVHEIKLATLRDVAAKLAEQPADAEQPSLPPADVRVVVGQPFYVAFDVTDATHFALYKDKRPVTIARISDYTFACGVRIQVPAFETAGTHTIGVSSLVGVPPGKYMESPVAELPVTVHER